MAENSNNSGGRARIESSALTALNLTKRQAEILAYVIEGKTNAEIGVVLAISRRTVEKHLERIFKRLGVENRTAAAATALYSLKRSR